MIGTRIGHFEIVAKLGEGGMGVVYKAEDTRLRRTVALKFLPAELTGDREARERLRLEAQTASALDHPNICTIHEISETPDGRVFIAMSYYDGQSLKQRIADGPLPIPEAIRFATATAHAMTAAHEAGIVHRDIKPANIMSTKRGDVKLVDFGVAKLSDRTELTRTGVTFGTIAYMAPEYVLGQAADPQTDVWALGVVLYEMLAGKRPFDGEHAVGVMNAIANTEPASLRRVRPDVPDALERIVAKALQKTRATRYASARDLLQDLEALAPAGTQSGAIATGEMVPVRRRRPAALIAAGLVAVTVVAAGGWWAWQTSRVRAARESLPQIRALIEQEKFSAAFRLVNALAPSLSGDREFEAARSALLLPTTIRTTPDGADLYVKGYDEPDATWIHLGRSPLETRGPNAYFRWRIEKPGFTTFEGAGALAFREGAFALTPAGTVPEGMVSVSGGPIQLTGKGTVPVESFFIDRHEVTNREFKAFVDAGGYSKQEYWRQPFRKDGRELGWEAGMALLRDATGQHGPASWELKQYPDGHDTLPVSGVSWYEALAYAAWAGKELPTVHHWRRAAQLGAFSSILEFSNFSNKQAAPVGTYKGLGEFGTFDMAGNVREWCWNAVDTKRYVLGGAWNQPNYLYQDGEALDAFDRAPINGFRTIKRMSAAPVAAALLAPIERLVRDYSRVVPVPDKEFEIYRRLYAYDKSDLKPTVESKDETHDVWRVERVSYAAAYGGERITAYLFLPRNITPPYQTVVYFPHSGGQILRSFEQSEMNYLGFVLRSGRALLLPMYKGTYERRLERTPDGPNAWRDLTINRIKDLQRSVDYLYSRADVDHDRLAYFGVSMGARLGNIGLAIEKRFKTSVLWSGGFRTTVDADAPEFDPVTFTPRVTTPVLMLNGNQDFTFPLETSQKPMFARLGTPAADKRHVVYEGGHVFPFARVIKDTLEWLDKYLGVPGAAKPVR